MFSGVKEFFPSRALTSAKYFFCPSQVPSARRSAMSDTRKSNRVTEIFCPAAVWFASESKTSGALLKRGTISTFNEAPSTKLQAPENIQAPNTKIRARTDWCLKLGAWNFIGAWCLEFGASVNCESSRERISRAGGKHDDDVLRARRGVCGHC